MKILNLNKQWPSKKYSEIFDLGWEKLTLSERDKEYSPSSAIGGNYEPFIKRYLSESALARSKVNSKKYKYGNKENQILEISCSNSSHSKKAAVPILVFFHGGYWQELSIQESFFPALSLAENGIVFAAVEYTLAPHASIDEIVLECREALNWLALNDQDLGIDKDKIILAGSSAGAHLAAMCSLSNSKSKIKPFGTVLVSGIYEIEPLIGTSIDKKLSLNPDQAVRNSPMLSSLKNFPSTIVAWGENETDQFKRQSKFFVNKLIDENVSVRSVEIKNKNHFDIILDLANFDEPLGKELKELLSV